MKNILQKQQMENITGGDWLCFVQCSSGTYFGVFSSMDIFCEVTADRCPNGWIHECHEID